jgi:hypothetical protein
MTTETQNKTSSNAVRINRDKLERAGRVARKVAANEDRDVSVASMVDEILEEGLSKRERKLGIV